MRPGRPKEIFLAKSPKSSTFAFGSKTSSVRFGCGVPTRFCLLPLPPVIVLALCHLGQAGWCPDGVGVGLWLGNGHVSDGSDLPPGACAPSCQALPFLDSAPTPQGPAGTSQGPAWRRCADRRAWRCQDTQPLRSNKIQTPDQVSGLLGEAGLFPSRHVDRCSPQDCFSACR
jgi:hypothetical protein